MMLTRKKIGMLLAEIFGTAVLTMIVLVQTNSVGAVVTSPWFVAATVALGVGLISLMFGAISGGHANPAVSVAAWTMKKISATTTIAFVAAQFLGALIAYSLFQYVTDSTLANIAGGFDWRQFVAVLSGAFVFGMGVAAAVSQPLGQLAKATVLGVSFMLGTLVACIVSNGILNPAVALGANSWNWTYVLAPILGLVLGSNLYGMFMSPLPEKKTAKK